MKNSKSKKWIALFIILFFSSIAIISISFISYNIFGFYSCSNAVQEIDRNIQTNTEEYLRIRLFGMTYSEDGNTVSGNFSIMNTNGNEIAVIERSWNGSYLAVEFVELNMQNKSFIFPLRIYGRNTIIENHPDKKKITTLDKYYNDAGLCLLAGVYASPENKRNLYKISRFAVKRHLLFDHKYKKIITVDLSSCVRGVDYSIVKNRNGQLELIEL